MSIDASKPEMIRSGWVKKVSPRLGPYTQYTATYGNLTARATVWADPTIAAAQQSIVVRERVPYPRRGRVVAQRIFERDDECSYDDLMHILEELLVTAEQLAVRPKRRRTL